jgi:hypothetical protein
MPVMRMHRGDRVHLSEWIDLMPEIRAIRFVAPLLDPRNTGSNAVGGEGYDVSNTAVFGARAARAAESKGDGVGGAPQLEPRATGPVEGKCGVEGDGASQKHTRTDS